MPRDGSELTSEDRQRLEDIGSADGLAALAAVMDADSEHDAYFAAKREWERLRRRELPPATREGLPGDSVTVDGRVFHVHGITHRDTRPERELLHDHVSTYLADGAAVYCEQGIRPMYFEEFPAVCEIDDYRWASRECRRLAERTRLPDDRPEFDGVVEDVTAAASTLRERAFSLIDSGSGVYGNAFAAALGDLASEFLMSHEEAATGEDFASFQLTRAAARNPRRLGELQRYYAATFLPQPIEREWLRRHDPDMEILTHARNEYMADYAVYHGTDVDTVHLIVGAAHQPGVVYYLQRHRDGHRSPREYEAVA